MVLREITNGFSAKSRMLIHRQNSSAGWGNLREMTYGFQAGIERLIG